MIAAMRPGATHRYLEELGLSRFTVGETQRSCVTTGWGVEGDEELIARALLQNFYDANRDQLHKINIDVEGRVVRISAPAEFDLGLLFYLSSTKGPRSTGRFGEGFKAATVCLLRGHGVEPVALSGTKGVHVRKSAEPVFGVDHALEYTHFCLSERSTRSGAELILPNCAPRLVQALLHGLDHFYHPTNPLFGRELWSRGEDFSIHRSQTGDGYAFYRNLRRAKIEGLPLILSINRPVKRLEKFFGQLRGPAPFLHGFL